jgi:hypothetical protein
MHDWRRETWTTLIALILVTASPAAAQSIPSHCERASGGTWPAAGEPIETSEAAPVTAAEAMQAVRRFRAAWRGVPHPSAVLRSFTQCMDASLEHFTVRRVSAAHARRGIEGLAGTHPDMVLSGSASAMPTTGWVWEVYWGGASRLYPPSGPVSAYFSPQLTLLAAVQWLEG